jgi:hypothetical protein
MSNDPLTYQQVLAQCIRDIGEPIDRKTWVAARVCVNRNWCSSAQCGCRTRHYPCSHTIFVAEQSYAVYLDSIRRQVHDLAQARWKPIIEARRKATTEALSTEAKSTESQNESVDGK